jgi:phosphoribosylglycinamide formyltransferase 2
VVCLALNNIQQHGPSASAVILVEGESKRVRFGSLGHALEIPYTQLRLFGKPEVSGKRRMGVALARGGNIDEVKALAVVETVTVSL